MKDTLILIAVCFLTFFAGLGTPAITDSDEGFYAESAREMVESGNWLTPHFNYSYRFEKPILYYWLAALTYTAVGIDASAARFPAALSGLGLVLITAAYARRLYGRQIGLISGIIVATSFGYVAMARQALPDLTLALFLTLTTWAALVACLNPGSTNDRNLIRDRVRLGWLLLAAIGAAGSILTKGPVGLVIPSLIVVPLLAWEHWTNRSKPNFRLLHLVLFLMVFLIFAAPWYLAMFFEHGTAYLDRFFIGENLDRFTTARYNEPRPTWYYLPILFSGMLPWSPFLLLWIPRLKQFTRDSLFRTTAATRLFWWAAAPLLFYTLSVGKQPRYILPVLPPLAILAAVAIHRHFYNGLNKKLLSFCICITGASFVIIAGFLYRAAPLFVEWDSVWLSATAAAIALSGISVLISASKPTTILWVIPTAAIIVTLSAHYVVLASPGLAPVEKMAKMLLAEVDTRESSSRYNVFNRNLIFYSGLPFQELSSLQAAREFLSSPTPVFLVLPNKDASRLESLGLYLRRLGEVRYLNTGGLQMRTLISPDPERYLRSVTLVTNMDRRVE